MTAQMNDKEIIEGLEAMRPLSDDNRYAKKTAIIDAALSRLQSIQWRPIEEALAEGEFVIKTAEGFVYTGCRVNGGDFFTYDTDEVCQHDVNETVGPMVAVIIEPIAFIPLSAFNQEEG